MDKVAIIWFTVAVIGYIVLLVGARNSNMNLDTSDYVTFFLLCLLWPAALLMLLFVKVIEFFHIFKEAKDDSES